MDQWAEAERGITLTVETVEVLCEGEGEFLEEGGAKPMWEFPL